jgi:arabinogalactan endo-1,4-beta-galactosidase
MKKIVFILIVLSVVHSLKAQTNTFISGVDISFVPQIQDNKGVFTVNGSPADVLDIFKSNGANWVRLRLWYNPVNGYCGLPSTIEFAKKVKVKGFKFLLDIHYSDSWADPGQQNKPNAWKDVSFTNLLDTVYNYTKFVITELKTNDVMPDMVQLGNEIVGGMLWDDGKNNSPEGWKALGQLLQHAEAGLKSVAGADKIKIMLHPGGYDISDWWFTNIISQNVSFDVIGLSFYSCWGGLLDSLNSNVKRLAEKFGKEILVAETAYPWTLAGCDNNGNIYNSASQLQPGYPATVQGQYDYIKALIGIIKAIPNEKGLGFFYWEPAWICTPTLSSSGENWAFFDFNGEALSSIKAFSVSTLSVENSRLPYSLELMQNYPNPFNPSTVIEYRLNKSDAVKCIVYDVHGREITTLVNQYKPAGAYQIEFTCKDLPSGVYVYRLITSELSLSRKMMLLK